MSENSNESHIWVSIGVTRLVGDPKNDALWDEVWAKVEAEVEEKLLEINQEMSS
jgi:hypothetical protein